MKDSPLRRIIWQGHQEELLGLDNRHLGVVKKSSFTAS